MTLSPEQLKEFPEGPLADFAAAWLGFQRSSPCTTSKTAFRYFQAPGPDGMSENDVLYGEDRGQAYRKLMWAFRRCQRRRLLDRYLGQGHTKYYESRSVPGLVILSEWAIEQVPFPGYYTGPYRGLRQEDYDEVWAAAGDRHRAPGDPVGNVRRVPELAVPDAILDRMENAMRAGTWSAQDGMQQLVVPYARYLLSEEPYAKLKELQDRSRREAIYLAVPGRESAQLCGALDKILSAMSGQDNEENEEKENDDGQ